MMMRPRKPQILFLIYHFSFDQRPEHGAMGDGTPRPALGLPDIAVPGTSAHLVSVF
jgi:hypothetical protein